MTSFLLLFMCATSPVSLAFCRGGSAGECPFEAEAGHSEEDASVLIQKTAFTSNLGSIEKDAAHVDFEFEEQHWLEDESDFMLDYEAEHMERNGSALACKKCWQGLRHGATRGAIFAECKKNVTAPTHGKWKRKYRPAMKACVRKLFNAHCADNCTYGTPCDKCKRGVSKVDKEKVMKACNANASAYMKALCADQCSTQAPTALTDDAGYLEIEEDEDLLVEARNEAYSERPNATQRKLQAKCTWCLRRDHNQGLERACTRKFHGPPWWPFGVACVGNGILKKCKQVCSFTDACSNCHRYAIISRKTWLVKADKKTCFNKGLGELPECASKCSPSNTTNASLAMK